MCSVVGYIGKQQSREVILDGLSRLEYRGYDSAGFACLDQDNSQLMYAKATGALSNLVGMFKKQPINGAVGIGHTRWATHGVANKINAHPHFDCQKTISLVHNGIIENHTELRVQLRALGHEFHSDTDSEVIAHLLEQALSDNSKTLTDAVAVVVKQLTGAYAFIAVLKEYPDTLIVVRKGSPLCVGQGEDEMFVASDVLAFAGKTRKVLFMPEQSFALVTRKNISLYNFSSKKIKHTLKELDAQWLAAEKDGHEHYMLKEIYEQREVIHKSVRFYKTISDTIWDHLGITKQQVKKLKKIVFIACGTSAHAGQIAQYFFEDICGLPTSTQLASEFRYRSFFEEKDVLYIAISQSGETADTLEAIRFLKERHQIVIALTNVASSTMVRECDGFLLTQAGPEVAVASTKAFSTQVTALYWLANRMALESKNISKKTFELAQDDLLVAAECLENSLERVKHTIVETLAPEYAQYEKFIFLGRHISLPFAQEAALKLKEIAYVFTQAYPSGELKHGPLALIDSQTPVCLFSHPDPIIYKKMLASAQEVKARKGKIIAFVFEGQDELTALVDHAITFPRVGGNLSILSMVGVMQVLMYYIARIRGCEIDKPRNLAKSVTVE
ncbi:MAG: glucosamine--fructose-6-phosphate aminotransferase (isomerizing) [Alteromonas naphthalenivorans]